MLAALSIRDFAIIDRVELDFGPGLTVITGETGAGKSILIDALNLVLGGRARAEVIRAGCDFAEVEALFELGQGPARERLIDAGIEAGEQLVVRRRIARSGRHRVYLNGTLATVQMLGTVARGLVDISGQHEHYSLLRPDFHLQLIDRIGGLGALREQVQAAHRAVSTLDARVAELRARERDRAQREDFLRYQLQELEEARLEDPAEEEALEQERRRLRNVERLRGSAREAEQALYGAKGAAVERLARAAAAVERLAELEPSLQEWVAELNSAHAIAEEAARTLGDYARNLSAEPHRLAEIEDRLGLFSRLRRKHGASLAEVIERMQAMQAEVEELAGAEGALEALGEERVAAGAALLGLADKLSAARRACGEELAGQVCAELKDLGMGGARLEVAVDPVASGVEVEGRRFGPRGGDRVELRLSANPGEPPQPLNRIASGGELSRFMLAVKRIIAEGDPVPTYIFDEVDAGVGGPTAEAIGLKLKQVSASRQAVCITHLPQIAALAGHHLHVSKRVVEDRTVSEVERLSAPRRVEELARMLGGARVTKKTRAHAEEMLRHGASH